jgi:hypothetical protein
VEVLTVARPLPHTRTRLVGRVGKACRPGPALSMRGRRDAVRVPSLEWDQPRTRDDGDYVDGKDGIHAPAPRTRGRPARPRGEGADWDQPCKREADTASYVAAKMSGGPAPRTRGRCYGARCGVPVAGTSPCRGDEQHPHHDRRDRRRTSPAYAGTIATNR